MATIFLFLEDKISIESDNFPDIKQLKQIVRDVVSPDHNLGHTVRPKFRPNSYAFSTLAIRRA
jgi:predicted Rdx family selenoprotein